MAGREGRTLVIALVAQWLGISLAALTFSPPDASLAPLLVEAATAFVCGIVMWLTLSAVDQMVPGVLPDSDPVQVERLRRAEIRARRRRKGQPTPLDQLWPLVIVLAGGMGGYALARLYPLGTSEATLLAFYWVILSGVLALVIDGSSEPVKLGVGLLALLNGAFMIVESLNPNIGGNAVALALMAACRIALAAIAAYTWGALRSGYHDLDLYPLFSSRDSGSDAEMALVRNEELPADE